MMERETADYLHGVTQLIEGFLPPTLVTPADLDKALGSLATYLHTHYPQHHIVHQTASYYYFPRNCHYMYNREHIFIRVPVPLRVSPDVYTVYKVLPFAIPMFYSVLSDNQPVIILSDDEKTFHHLRITDVQPYFAISKDHATYMTLTQTDIDACSGQPFHSCTLPLPVRSIADDSCELALYLADIPLTKKYCHFQHVINPQRIVNMFMVNPGQAVLVNVVDDIIVQCPLVSPQKLSGCKFCIVHVPCQCSVQAGLLSLPATLGQCAQPKDTSVTQHFPINLPLLSRFFEPHELANYTKTMRTDPLSFELPPFELVTRNWSQLAHVNDEIVMNLSKVAEHVRNRKPVYFSATDHLADDLTLPGFDLKFSIYGLPLVNLAIALATLGITVYLCFRLRQLTTVISVLSAVVPSAKANIIRWSDSNSSPTDLPDVHIDLSAYTHHVIMTLAVLLAILVLYKTVKCLGRYVLYFPTFQISLWNLTYRLLHKLTSEIILEICSHDDIVTIHLLTVPFDSGRIAFDTVPYIHTVDLQPGFLISHLLVTWSDGAIKVDNRTDVTINLPKLIRIPTCYATRFKAILAQSHYTRLLYGTHGIYMPLATASYPSSTSDDTDQHL